MKVLVENDDELSDELDKTKVDLNEAIQVLQRLRAATWKHELKSPLGMSLTRTY